MSSNEEVAIGQPKELKEEKAGRKAYILVGIAVLLWSFVYFVLGPHLTTIWWHRDLLASGSLVVVSLFAPRQIRGLAICLALWLLIAHLSHDYIFMKVYPDAKAAFSTELLLWLLSWVPAAIAGIIIIAALVLPHVWFASEFVLAFRHAFGLSRLEAMKALLTTSFGLQLPYSIIEVGQETITKPKGMLNKIGGPGLVIIRPANAVAYERLGKITQIVGPGRALTKLFEFKKDIVQLRPRWIPFEAEDMMTKDGIALKLKGGIGAQIESAQRSRELIQAAAKRKETYSWAWKNAHCRDLISGDFPVFKDSVFKAIYRPAGKNWEQALSGAALSALREAVGRRRLEDLFGDPSEGVIEGPERLISVLEQEVQEQLNSWVHEWGIQTGKPNISVLAPPDEIQEKVRRRWKTAGDKANIEQISEAEAGALRIIEATKKNSFDEMTRALQSAMQRLTRTYGEEGPLRFQEILAMIAANIGRDNITTLRYIEALEKLSNHPNAHIVITPGSQNVNIDHRE